MKEIKLAGGQIAMVDDGLFDHLNQWRWIVRKYGSLQYAARYIWVDGKRRKIRMHREILGLTDPKILVDHRDGNGLNNQLSNLRIATHSENMRNRKMSGLYLSQYRGVTRDRRIRKWRARIRVNGKMMNLGYFENEECAARAYNIAAAKYAGEFARLNPV